MRSNYEETSRQCKRLKVTLRPRQSRFLGCLLLLTSLALRAEPTEFEIVQSTADFPLLVDGNTVVGIPYPQIAEPAGKAAPGPSDAEQYLARVNETLKRGGYMGPALAPRVTYAASGVERFRMLLYDFENGGLEGFDPNAFGTYHAGAGCGITEPQGIDKSWISINAQKYTGGLYQRMSKLTHELFHAYQFAHPLFQSSACPDNWILEGLADAVANFTSENAFRVQFAADRRNFNTISLRSYRIAFQDEMDWASDPYFNDYARMLLSADSKGTASQQVMYLTSGFWQFLARRSTGIRPDFASPGELSRLMAAWVPLLQQQPAGHVLSGTGWLRIVNDYVAEKLPLEKNKEVDVLYGWLPEFFTEYASWWHLRHRSVSREYWLKHAFGGCEKVELRPGSKAARSSRKITISSMAKNSARCVEVQLSGFTNPVSLKVRADNFGTADPDQFHLGLAHIDVPSGISPFSCWNKHNDSRRLQCRRLAKAEQEGKVWKAEQITARMLESGNDSLDATLTYVFSNVSPKIDESSRVESVDLTFAATYDYGGNKKFAPPGSIRPLDPKALAPTMNRKETFYRLYTGAPANPNNLFDLELNEIDSGEQPRCGGDAENTYCAYDTGGDYYIKPGEKIQLGRTGRIRAAVYKNANGSTALMSTSCSTDADLKAVEILDSGDDGIVLRINTDLCEVPSPHNDYCNKRPNCPVRDRLLTTLTLGLGREHFADTAPIHVSTPGTRFDMELYFRGGVPTGPSVSSTDPDSEMGSGSDRRPTPGSGSQGPEAASPAGSHGATGTFNTCSCTCEEREAAIRRGAELRAGAEAGAEVTMDQIASLSNCSGVCQREYMICELEATKEARRLKEASKQPATAQADCDCSCGGLDALEQQNAALLSQVQAGAPPPLEALERAGNCMSACVSQYAACRTR